MPIKVDVRAVGETVPHLATAPAFSSLHPQSALLVSGGAPGSLRANTSPPDCDLDASVLGHSRGNWAGGSGLYARPQCHRLGV